MKKFFKIIGILIGLPVITAALLIGLQYAWCPVYDFPAPEPFSGTKWYNPYENVGQRYFQANFHVHSKSWFGMTNGNNSPEMVRKYYNHMGYDIVSISNYQSITESGEPRIFDIPVYEHGYNTGKVHQIALGAKRVVWLDYVLGQGIHHKQHVIYKLRENTDFVILAHPVLYNAYKPVDMHRLEGYHAVEVLNHFRFSFELWDAALSSGRRVWGFAGDDSHDVTVGGDTGVCWTIIYAKSKKRRQIVKAIHKGNHYMVSGRRGKLLNRLKKLEIKGNGLRVSCELPAEKLRFIGQDGKVRKELAYVDTAELELLPSDTYIRTEILREDCSLYLNPVIRYNGEWLPGPTPVVNQTRTWVQRLVVLILLSFPVFIIVKRLFFRRG